MNQTFISLDLEMTSVQPENQEIIEIAAIKFRGDKVLESWSTMVNPHCAIPYNIQVLTGISQQEVDRAPSLPEVAGQLIKFVEDYPIVAHTVSSDMGCLERKGIHLSNPQLDTFELASILLPQLGGYSLAALAEHLGLSFPTQHRAAADALVTKELFTALLEKARELDLTVLQEINRLTAGLDWPPKMIFRDLEREKVRTAFGGTSIRQRLAAQGGLEEAMLDSVFAAGSQQKPLAPAPQRRPLDVEALAAMLEPGGLLSQHLGQYEYRPVQSQMLRAAAEAFNNDEFLVVEAGTGTGKSVAYLLPAIHFATQNGRRVVVSTNTINLQDQLCGKDIPGLERMLPVQFRAALVKGRSNYLCLLHWASMRRRLELSPDEILTLVKTLVWLPRTLTGDVAELSLTDAQRAVWRRLSATAEACTGHRCPYFKSNACFLYRARNEAESAHIVVVNHALLLSDLATENRVLPEYQHLIIDEAHHLEDEATHQLGYSVGQREVYAYLNDLSEPIASDRHSGLLAELKAHLRGSTAPSYVVKDIDELTQKLHGEVERAREAGQEFFRVLSLFLQQQGNDSRAPSGDRGGYETRLRITPAVRSQPGWAQVDIAWERASLRLAAIQEGVGQLYTIFASLEEHRVLEYDELMARFVALTSFNAELRQRLKAIIADPTTDRQAIHWVSVSPQRSEIALHTVPLVVGEILREQLFSTKECAILTSATLSTAGQCGYIKERLGLEEARELVLDSSFDYARSTLIYLPTDIPEPDRPNYQRSVEEAIAELCTATEGRTLVLFTSHSQLRRTWEAVHQPLAEQGILVLGQGIDAAPRRQLLHTFKTGERVVLLGAASFWEGIDVVGEALSVLVIPRLPFAVPSDPVFAARSETFDDPFNSFSVPQTILRFKQGFGRLIRSQSDRGVVVVLDRRLQTKPYGRAFLRSLPPCTQQQGPLRALPAAAVHWLHLRDRHSATQPVGPPSPGGAGLRAQPAMALPVHQKNERGEG